MTTTSSTIKKIFLKDSDIPRLADKRARIVCDIDAREPCDNEDLVFIRVWDECEIPADAIYSCRFDPQDHEPIWLYTTAERCKELVSPDPSAWTQKKLQAFAAEEKKLYKSWDAGHVYGFIIEEWSDTQRTWVMKSSLWGMYGAESLLSNLSEELGGSKIPVCVDSEDLKHDFENVETELNEFSEA